mmetsp:Transcript_28868/g.69359  ORF Transcript_28868/g.69359 Transcript_28868/m.69359 type:complete len:257 (-) Transcript_28868:58-828(-)
MQVDLLRDLQLPPVHQVQGGVKQVVLVVVGDVKCWLVLVDLVQHIHHTAAVGPVRDLIHVGMGLEILPLGLEVRVLPADEGQRRPGHQQLSPGLGHGVLPVQGLQQVSPSTQGKHASDPRICRRGQGSNSPTVGDPRRGDRGLIGDVESGQGPVNDGLNVLDVLIAGGVNLPPRRIPPPRLILHAHVALLGPLDRFHEVFDAGDIPGIDEDHHWKLLRWVGTYRNLRIRRQSGPIPGADAMAPGLRRVRRSRHRDG